MTNRDSKVVEFVTKCPCYSNTIQNIFYPSRTVSNRRLTILVDYGYLKRYREHTHEFYFYYAKRKPKQMKHSDYIARTYYWIIKQGYEVTEFCIQKRIENIIPDMLCILKQNNKVGELPIEIELGNSNIENKIRKYEKSKFKKLLFVSNKEVDSDIIDIINVKLCDI